MPFTVEVIPDRKLRLVTFAGLVTNDTLREYGQRLLTEPDYDPNAHVLVDLRNANLDITADAVWGLAETMQRRGLDGHRNVAIVGTSDVAYAYGRMYQSLLEQGLAVVRVFRDFEDAMDWLTR